MKKIIAGFMSLVIMIFIMPIDNYHVTKASTSGLVHSNCLREQISNDFNKYATAIKKICPTCNGTGQTRQSKNCTNCNGQGKLYSDICTKCKGAGRYTVKYGENYYGVQTCSLCNGKGKFDYILESICPYCDGKGKQYYTATCPTCRGGGYVTEEITTTKTPTTTKKATTTTRRITTTQKATTKNLTTTTRKVATTTKNVATTTKRTTTTTRKATTTTRKITTTTNKNTTTTTTKMAISTTKKNTTSTTTSTSSTNKNTVSTVIQTTSSITETHNKIYCYHCNKNTEVEDLGNGRLKCTSCRLTFDKQSLENIEIYSSPKYGVIKQDGVDANKKIHLIVPDYSYAEYILFDYEFTNNAEIMQQAYEGDLPNYYPITIYGHARKQGSDYEVYLCKELKWVFARYVTLYDYEILLGDINNDKYINAVDASVVLSYYAAISINQQGDFDNNKKAAADVNHDGLINAVDASCILSYYAYTSTGGTLGLKDFLNNTSTPSVTTTTITSIPQTTTTTTTKKTTSTTSTSQTTTTTTSITTSTTTSSTTTILPNEQPNIKCHICGQEFFATGVGSYGIQCPNCNKYFFPTDLNPTEKDKLYASKYPGIWHSEHSNEHELTIHAINSHIVSFNIWFYRLWGVEFQCAYFEENTAYFTTFSGDISGKLTFEDDYIVLTFTKSDFIYLETNKPEKYTVNNLFSVEYDKQYSSIEQLTTERVSGNYVKSDLKNPYINEHFVGSWKPLNVTSEVLYIESIDSSGVTFSLSFIGMYSFKCEYAKIEGNRASFKLFDGPYDYIVGYITFSNYLLTDDKITINITESDAPGIGSNIEMTYYKT